MVRGGAAHATVATRQRALLSLRDSLVFFHAERNPPSFVVRPRYRLLSLLALQNAWDALRREVRHKRPAALDETQYRGKLTSLTDVAISTLLTLLDLPLLSDVDNVPPPVAQNIIDVGFFFCDRSFLSVLKLNFNILLFSLI